MSCIERIKTKINYNLFLELEAAVEEATGAIKTFNPALKIREATQQQQIMLQNAASLYSRARKAWFLPKKAKENLHYLRSIAEARKIAQLQDLPFVPLLKNPDVRKVVLANHLHRKITAQHRSLGLGLTFDKSFALSVPQKEGGVEKAVSLPLRKVFGENAVCKTNPFGKTPNGEFLEHGFTVHSAKKWRRLQATYEVSVESGNFVHIDNLTGTKEIIGSSQDSHVQIVNVLPWFYDLFTSPWNGPWNGHTYLRVVVKDGDKGRLYHIGGDLGGGIINPDFMATFSMEKRRYTAYSWATIKEQAAPSSESSLQNTNRGQRLIRCLENLQAKILKQQPPHKACERAYGASTWQEYRKVIRQLGGTCSSAAIALFEIMTGRKQKKTRGSLLYRMIYNPVVVWLLDCIWSVLPDWIYNRIILPLQIVFRGKKPLFMPEKLD